MSESACIAFLILVAALAHERDTHEYGDAHADALKTAMRVQHWPRMTAERRGYAWTWIGVYLPDLQTELREFEAEPLL